MERDDRQWKTQRGLLFCMAIFSVLLLMVVDGKAAEPSYPSRPIELVTHNAPGGAMDVFVRLISDIIQKEKILNQPLVVVNKPGSGGAISLGYALAKKGNPHVVVAVGTGSFLLTPLLEKLPYNYKSFTPIANMAVDGNLLVVRSDSSFKTVDDIIAEAKKRPKELIQGGPSFTSNVSMAGRYIQKLKGVKWNFISFPSDPEALLNVLSGNVHFAFSSPQTVLDYVRAGKLRVLLTGAPNRYAEFKDVPTTQEAGLGEPWVTNRGIVGPPDMPEYAVKKLEAAFKKVMDSDRFKKYMKDMLMQPFFVSSQDYLKLLDKESDRWKVSLSELDLEKK